MFAYAAIGDHQWRSAISESRHDEFLFLWTVAITVVVAGPKQQVFEWGGGGGGGGLKGKRVRWANWGWGIGGHAPRKILK